MMTATAQYTKALTSSPTEPMCNGPGSNAIPSASPMIMSAMPG